MERSDLEYVGFWPRVGAAVIDTLLFGVICGSLVTAIYGRGYWMSTRLIAGPADFLITWVFPAVAVVLFWVYSQATPGKMAISAKIVDAATGQPATTGQYIIRYFGYFISIIAFCVGLFWVAFDAKKQGWHDKFAGTVVVRSKNRGPASVTFDG